MVDVRFFWGLGEPELSPAATHRWNVAYQAPVVQEPGIPVPVPAAVAPLAQHFHEAGRVHALPAMRLVRGDRRRRLVERGEAAEPGRCGSGFWGGQRPSLADYVRGPAATPRRARRQSVLMLPTLCRG